jgi:hypothetical protein
MVKMKSGRDIWEAYSKKPFKAKLGSIVKNN